MQRRPECRGLRTEGTDGAAPVQSSGQETQEVSVGVQRQEGFCVPREESAFLSYSGLQLIG